MSSRAAPSRPSFRLTTLDGGRRRFAAATASARRAAVGGSITALAGNVVPKRSLHRPMSKIARSESPPRTKKSSSVPIAGLSKQSRQISSIGASTASSRRRSASARMVVVMDGRGASYSWRLLLSVGTPAPAASVRNLLHFDTRRGDRQQPGKEAGQDGPKIGVLEVIEIVSCTSDPHVQEAPLPGAKDREGKGVVDNVVVVAGQQHDRHLQPGEGLVHRVALIAEHAMAVVDEMIGPHHRRDEVGGAFAGRQPEQRGGTAIRVR